MIYLIGGSPRCGKTILAKKIANSKKISWITTDAVRPIILNSLPKNSIGTKFPQTTMKAPRNKFRFDVYSAESMMKAQLVEANTMWPGTKALIEHFICREQNYVIEGVHLLPKYINQLKKNSYYKKIKIIYLIKRDIDKIINDFPKNKNEYDWMLPSIIGNKERLEKAARMVQAKSEYFYKEARKYGLKIINTDTDFNGKLKEATKYLTK